MAGAEENANAADAVDASITKAPLPGMIAVGAKIVQKIVRPVFTVDGYHISTDGKTFQYKVSTVDEAGEKQERYFTHDQIEEAAQ
jgi:hypothetical protein